MTLRHLLAVCLATALVAGAAPAFANGDYYERRTETRSYDYDDGYDDDRYDHDDRYDRYDDDDDYDRRTYYRREVRRVVPRYHRTIVEHRIAPYVHRTHVFYDGPCRVERAYLSTGAVEETRRCPAPSTVVIQPAPVVEYRY
ncbi:MAG TPA: hypothetical protein VEL28_10830 [Candidatus Binatia bacterium]|nr:hypothetical protein [Candidatus Binatia bacterium]